MEKKASQTEILENPQEIFELISNGCNKKAPLFISTREQNIVIKNCNLAQIFSDSFSIRINRMPVKEQLDEIKADPFALVMSKKASIFFRPEIKECQTNGMVIGIPKKIAMIQRRSHLRWTIRIGQVVRVSFHHPAHPKQEFIHQMHDLSSSGLSFIIEQNFREHFIVGTYLTNIFFTLPNHENFIVSTDGIIRHVTFMPDNMAKVGIEFTSISDIATKHIREFSLLEQQKEFTNNPDF
jgi:c-di-GMP-binding flagellar brake protein YcgR